MGQVKSKVFTDKELNDYQDLTYLTKVEILRAYDRFNALCTEPDRYQKNPVVGVDEIMNIPELKVNPFRDRICSVFASDESYMSFEDFLDMISVFSDHASKAVKTEYAFRIYDFDEDDYVSQSDLKQVIERLVGNNELEDSDVQEIIDNIMAEADLDGDYILNFAEFEHVIAKLPDFEKSTIGDELKLIHATQSLKGLWKQEMVVNYTIC